MKQKFYFMNGKEDAVTTWLNNSNWAIILIAIFVIICCGLIGD